MMAMVIGLLPRAAEFHDAAVLSPGSAVLDFHLDELTAEGDLVILKRDALTEPFVDGLGETRLGDAAQYVAGRLEHELPRPTAKLRQKKSFARIREDELKQLVVDVLGV